MTDYKLVPSEATLEMGWAYLEAAEKSVPDIRHTFNHQGYRAMLAAAPAVRGEPVSEFKGVLGPWTIGESSRHGIHCVDAVDPKDGLLFEVCEVWGIDHHAEETQRSMANARLIAAAPALLEFIMEWLDQQVTDNNYMTSKARTVIAKVLGEEV